MYMYVCIYVFQNYLYHFDVSLVMAFWHRISGLKNISGIQVVQEVRLALLTPRGTIYILTL